MRNPEHGAVGEEGLLVGVIRVEPSRGILGRVPGVQMSVEVNHSHVAVDFIQGSKGWKGNTVVTTQTQQLGLLSVANVRLRVFGRRRSMCEVRMPRSFAVGPGHCQMV